MKLEAEDDPGKLISTYDVKIFGEIFLLCCGLLLPDMPKQLVRHSCAGAEREKKKHNMEESE